MGLGFRVLLQRVRVGALVAVAVVLTAGCKVDVNVRVNSTADGSGTVRVTATLDREAAAQAGALELDDLKRAGWTVTSTDEKGGGRTVTAAHHFDTPAQLSTVLAQVGPFEGVELRTDRSLLTTTTKFAGRLDLTPGLAVFSDNDLRAKLGGPGIGLDPAAIKDATGADIGQVVDLGVTVAIPGRTLTRKATLGQTLTLAADASHYNTTTIAYLVVGAVAFVVAIVLIVAGRRRST